MARRYRQVIDLYTIGKVVTLKGDTPVWVQPLNPFEQDTARNEAMIAKSRISLAIKEFGSDEQAKVRMFFFEDGIEEARKILVEAKLNEATPKLFDQLRIDPDWTERVQLIDRGSEDTAKPLEETERKLLTQAANEFAAEIGKRINDEREWLISKYDDLDEEPLWEEYLSWFIDRRASDVAMAEYKLHQLFYGVRWCDGEKTDAGWSHDACNGHEDRLFATKDDVRTAPADLLETLSFAVEDVEMTAREAKLGQAGEFLRLVSSAKRGGGVDCLYPERNPSRAPWFLVVAVSHALTVLGWGKLTDDQRPPMEIWLDDEAVQDHFERVKERMNSKTDTGSGGDWEDIPADSQNEYTKGLRKG